MCFNIVDICIQKVLVFENKRIVAHYQQTLHTYTGGKNGKVGQMRCCLLCCYNGKTLYTILAQQTPNLWKAYELEICRRPESRRPSSVGPGCGHKIQTPDFVPADTFCSRWSAWIRNWSRHPGFQACEGWEHTWFWVEVCPQTVSCLSWCKQDRCKSTLNVRNVMIFSE